MKKSFIVVLLVFGLIALLTIQVNAKTLTYQEFKEINSYRQMRMDTILVDGYARMWSREHREDTDFNKVFNAIYHICDITEYSAGKYKASDILNLGVGNCQAYSEMFQKLMYFSGVDCFVEYNDVHMWNKVKLNGKWYKIDITNLDTITESR